MVFLFVILLFNFEKITGSAVRIKNPVVSLSSDGERFFDNPAGNTVTLDAGNSLYVKLTPAENNKRVFIYDSRSASKASTFVTKCFKREGVKCVSSLAGKGIPLVRSHFNDKMFVKLEPEFKEIQAKQNLINLSLESFME